MKPKVILHCLFFLITFSLQAQDDNSIPKNDFSKHLKITLLKPDGTTCVKGLVDVFQRNKNGTLLVVASATVYFDSCGNPKMTHLCQQCKDATLENDTFIYSKGKFNECIVDCLKKDKVLLASYHLEKEKVLATRKK